jgi:hypothetical protein
MIPARSVGTLEHIGIGYRCVRLTSDDSYRISICNDDSGIGKITTHVSTASTPSVINQVPGSTYVYCGRRAHDLLHYQLSIQVVTSSVVSTFLGLLEF